MLSLKLIYEGIVEKVAVEFLSKLVKESPFKGKVYLAGGYVRDEILGLDPKDIDIVVEFPDGGIKFAEWVTKKLGVYRSGSNPVIYPKYGTAKFNMRGISFKGYDLSNIDIECVMTRKETYSADSRKPKVQQGTIQNDVDRRDLTVNSLLKDLTTGEILDLTGKGMSDIKNGLVRTPIHPDEIFKDDPLRMLRAIRFAVKYNWKLPFFMIKAMKDNAYRLKIISNERIRDELDKMLKTGSPDKAIRLLQLTGLSQLIFPELDRLIKLKQNKYHEYDAMKHTLFVLKNTPANLIARLAALFHDIGKSATKEIIDNEIHFYRHEEVSAEMVEDILTRLKYPKEIIIPVKIAVANHMRTKQFGQNAEIVSDKALRKLQADLGDHLETVLDVIHADNISHGNTADLPNQVPSIKNRLKSLNTQQPSTKIILPVTGNDVMKLTGLKPGKQIGDILDYLKDAWLEDPNMSRHAAENLIIKYMKDHKI